MKVLITGAGGFVGHHAVEYLIHNTDWELVLTDSFKHAGKTSRIRSILENMSNVNQKRIKIVTHDLSTPIDNITAKEFGNIEAIINYASYSDVDQSIINPIPFVQNNINISLSMLEYARQLDSLNIFIQISTDEVYGPLESTAKHTEWEPLYPSNPYSASKVGQEALTNAYWRTFDLPLIITNSMNMFGERQDLKAFIPKVIQNLLNNRITTVHAKEINGILHKSNRCYTHAKNQVDGIKFLIETFANKSIRFSEGNKTINKFNIAGETTLNNDDLVIQIAHILNIKQDKLFEYIDPQQTRPGFDLSYGLDISKIKSLGWKEPISFDKSLEQTVLWTKNNPMWL